MSQALILSGFHFMEFEEIRMNVVRVPEVLARLRTVQKLWNRFEVGDQEIQNILVSSDSHFYADQKIQELLVKTVQMGFYDRYLKKFAQPKHIIFDEQSAELVKCIIGEESFESYVTDLLFEIKAQKGAKPVNRLSSPKYSLLEDLKGDASEVKLQKNRTDLDEVLRFAMDKYLIKEFVQIGPSLMKGQLKSDYAMTESSFSDSVELDPMLSWFWGEMQPLVMENAAVC